jgi:LuxR family maltose regulon positive regulatory protein
MAPTPLLATKLYVPPLHGDVVARTRLVDRLESGLRQRLTLVAAPAGFGKSTLVATWAARTRVPVAWLSLDEEDGAPLRFLAYLIAALQRVEPDLGDRTLRALHAAQPPAPIAAATSLINEMATGSRPIALVLDDYHRVDVAGVRDLTTFLVEHAPTRLHLVLVTRQEPHLPVARLRARGQVHELRSEDLRFDAAETAAFLADSMGLAVAPEEARELEARTEGWVTGLQLAALSLRGREDVTTFVRSFAGGHRHVFDYLTHEVLRRQTAPVRAFLLAISVLDRLCAPLCDALTGGSDAAERLADLERAHLFLVPLDDERQWFRFHALFADALRAEARRSDPDALPELHRRAAAWFAARGAHGEAIHHAQAAGDVDAAVRLLEKAWRPMDRAYQTPTWQAWARRLPDEALRARPIVAVGLAWERLSDGDLDGAERWLRSAEHRLEAAPGDDAADDLAFRSLPSRIAAAHAYLAQARGDGAAAEAHAQRALASAPDDDPGVAALPAGLLGLTYWARGDLDEAREALRTGMAGFRALGDAAAALSFTFAIADVLLTQGRLREARTTFEEALRDAEDAGDPSLPGMAELHVGLAEVLIAMGDPERAAAHALTAEALGDAAVLPGDAGRLAAAYARIALALGDAEAAHERLDEAARLQVMGPVPDVRPVDAIRTRVWLAQGRWAEARGWAEGLGDPLARAPDFLADYLLLTVARVGLARFRVEGNADVLAATGALLERIAGASAAGGRIGALVEARVLHALVAQSAGDPRGAGARLAEALRLAEPERWRAVFVDEGPAMARLLHASLRHGAPRAFVRRLLDDLRAAGDRPRVRRELAEPLSDRERDVLRLLRGDLTGPQVARELGMSVHTLRSHTKSIYAKLDAHGRREAVARADELGLT